jgi:hypothetical protein
MKRFFIGDVAKRFGLNPRTIRYYETIGILPKPSHAHKCPMKKVLDPGVYSRV